METLKNNSRVACCAGWVANNDGHAMIAEAFLDQNSSGKARIRLYNEGDGVEYHYLHKDRFRERRDAYLEKVDVPENLVFCPAFWMILLGMNRGSEQTDDPYQAEDLYSWFIDVIPGEVKSASVQILPHRSGTCTIKSILAFLKTYMNETDYDLFILRLKFGLLARYEEDLPYRCQEIVNGQQGLLCELRGKLIESVKHQERVGRIDDKRARLLKEYCLIKLQKKKSLKVQEHFSKLTGMFALKSSSNICSKKFEENSDDIESIFAGCKPAKTLDDVLGILERFKSAFIKVLNLDGSFYMLNVIWLKNYARGVIYADENFNPNNILYAVQDLVSLMPSLSELEFQFQHNPQSSFKFPVDLLIMVRKVMRFLEYYPFEKRTSNPLLYAWLLEFANIWARSYLKQRVEVDLFTAAEAGMHPLEMSQSPLYSLAEPLNVATEKILLEWVQYRAVTKERPRSFKWHVKTKNIFPGNYNYDQVFYEKWKKLFPFVKPLKGKYSTFLFEMVTCYPSPKDFPELENDSNWWGNKENQQAFLAYTFLIPDRFFAENEILNSTIEEFTFRNKDESEGIAKLPANFVHK